MTRRRWRFKPTLLQKVGQRPLHERIAAQVGDPQHGGEMGHKAGRRMNIADTQPRNANFRKTAEVDDMVAIGAGLQRPWWGSIIRELAVDIILQHNRPIFAGQVDYRLPMSVRKVNPGRVVKAGERIVEAGVYTA